MTNQPPMLPTQEQFAEWDSEYFDGERQNFDSMMLKAFQAGANQQLEQVKERVKSNLKVWRRSGYIAGADAVEDFFEEIMQAMKKERVKHTI